MDHALVRSRSSIGEGSHPFDLLRAFNAHSSALNLSEHRWSTFREETAPLLANPQGHSVSRAAKVRQKRKTDGFSLESRLELLSCHLLTATQPCMSYLRAFASLLDSIWPCQIALAAASSA